MRDKISESTQKIFHAVWERIAPFHEMIQSRPAVLSYSGGKDSSILLHFYFWLWIEKNTCALYLSSRPFDPIQFRTGKKIFEYADSTFPFSKIFKKRIFLLCQEG
ncbi:hypothetical protein LEP1GSC083_3786 [Leptospira interrogans serovar Pyrogenes str. L0374]|uniref:PP-loop domain protein n=1 Tax=Leptospira interrogans serovar Pyrogenes str. L0374 TaxID=1049928 RepID=M6KU89_LEPIR|nr:hypothetical protein LEP1GSC083_3786 [Leptospira interrogans serovar Pyrogenes str. L0374]